MTEYFLVMLALMVPAIFLPQRQPSRVAWAFAFILLLAFIGFRHKVGMDWNNYLFMIAKVRGVGLIEALSVAEPGYAVVLWLADRTGVGIYGANILTTAIFLAGVFKLCSKTPLPWVGLVVAFPVLLVVVGMSANRQAAAIGILMWLVSSWESSSLVRRVSLIVLASMFHFSAIVFLLFAALSLRAHGVVKLLTISILSVAAVLYLQASGGAEYYDQAYISGQSSLTYSPGATQHVLLNGLPAIAWLLSGRFRARLLPSSVLVGMAWLAIVLVPISFLFSTAAGRMTLYLFPVSIWILSAASVCFRDGTARAIVRTSFCAIQFAILWIWLNYANSSHSYVPYQNSLMLSEWELHR